MFNNPKHVKDFILAGNAILTLESEKTGKHLTFRIRKLEDRDVWFTSLLTGPDNTSDFTYLGMVKLEGDTISLVLTKKSSLTDTSEPVLAFRFLLSWLSAGKMPPRMHVHHEGRCGRCRRRLTVPESIESGFGPECAGRLGLT
jgi:hypothetical protein